MTAVDPITLMDDAPIHLETTESAAARRARLSTGGLLGLLGVVLLAVLVFFGLFVGAAMLVIGLAWRLLARRSPQAGTATGDGRIVDAEYRVIERPELPAPR